MLVFYSDQICGTVAVQLFNILYMKKKVCPSAYKTDLVGILTNNNKMNSEAISVINTLCFVLLVLYFHFLKALNAEYCFSQCWGTLHVTVYC